MEKSILKSNDPEHSTINKEMHNKISKMIDDLNGDVRPKIESSQINTEEEELTDDERRFLSSIERGDAPTVKMILDNRANLSLNINCTDSLGRNGLHIAIENELNEMLELLLSFNLDIADSLLHAISEENIEAVEIILIEMGKRPKKKDLLDLLGNSSNAFTSDITPLILAAHRDNYIIIKMLLERGDSIPNPHDLKCRCHECMKSQKEDSLRHSRSRINAYKALSSPSLICLTSKDPILRAFELSYELRRLGIVENEFKSEYEFLTDQCQQYATDLLNQTRGSTELATILNHDHGKFKSSSMNILRLDSNNDSNEENDDSMTLSRFKLAIQYNQKSFVVHSHCQQLLSSLWYEGLPGIRTLSYFHQWGVIGLICGLFPLLSVLYTMVPDSKIGSMAKRPIIKFLCHQSSYLFFLLLLIASGLKVQFMIFGNYLERLSDRGPPPCIIEWAIIIYIAGYIWQEIKQLYSNGLLNYLADMWNLLDFLINSFFCATLGLRVTAYFNVINSPIRHMGRGNWDAYEPVLISESLFAFATIFSVLKLVFMFTINPTLGPLQISLGRMLRDIINCSSVYILVLFAYAFGIHQLMWFYAYERKEVCKNVTFTYEITDKDLERYQYCVTRGRYFSSIFEIVQALYWTTFGLIELPNLSLEHDHEFTEFIGKLMFGSYSYISIIMLLNMFVAMMNNSYQIIAEKADEEWKFARSKLLMSYFEEGATVPVPFNLIPSLKSFRYFVLTVKNFLLSSSHSHNQTKWKSVKKLVKKVNEKEAQYQMVMQNLIKRYLIQRQKSEENQGVTEDDLNEIKGDISSFRFEIIEIFKLNDMKIPAYTTAKNHYKLRRKGSRKGFNRLMKKLDPSNNNQRDTSMENDNESAEPTVTFDTNKIEKKTRVAYCFDNEGYQNTETEEQRSTAFTRIVISEPEENTSTTAIPNQPLNVSDLIQALKNTEEHDTVSQLEPRDVFEENVKKSKTSRRSDMV